MAWFAQKPKAVTAPEMGALLCAYARDRLVSSEPTTSLRRMLSDESVTQSCRENFDANVFVLTLFIAFVAARRRHPIKVAETILAGALTPFLAVAGSGERDAVIARLENYREFCPAANRGEELAALVSIGCGELFDSDGEDFLLRSSVTLWATALLKMFEDVVTQTPMKP